MITRTTCRVCEGPLQDVFSLGEQYVSNFLSPGEPDGVKAPLDLVLCTQCTLLQLRHTVPADAMYQNYWYRSGTNQTMRDALADIASIAEQLIDLQIGDTVLDIGCNDGTLLSSYKTKGLIRIGFDPASNLASISKRVATLIIEDFFTAENYAPIDYFKPMIVTSIAMFYDLEDPNKFVSDVKKVMHPDGIWVLQMSYLPAMLEQHDFGNICHEHLEYYSLKSLEYLLDRHDMVVVDVRTNSVNGGSFRVFIQKRDGVAHFNESAYDRLEVMRLQEAEMKLSELKIYNDFAIWATRIRHDVFQFVRDQVSRGKKVVVYGASTKGNTMLQYFNLDHNWITAASERNPDKWGLVTVGTKIPIVSEEEARAMKPDYFLVLPWHFLNEFCIREKKYLQDGGKFIVPLPHFTLI
jgi:NDP-4-keto-2,6-dideoxyhexose 3-C-methyltransferase